MCDLLKSPILNDIQFGDGAQITAPYAAVIGDLDGDGRADLTVSNSGYSFSTGVYSDNTLSILANNNNGTLPLKLLSFTGKLINDLQVELTWQTTDELNVSRFEAEWCNDGSSWSTIATVAAKNEGQLTNSYSCLHTTLSASNFYRLKMVDLDGRSTYSQVLTINVGKENVLVLYPNPAKNSIAITDLGNIPALISVVSLNGKIILQKSVNTTVTALDISTLARGIYLVQIKQTDKTTVVKLAKE